MKEIYNYSDFVDRDIAENMSRLYYRGDTVIRIYRRNLEVKALSAKFFPDKNGKPAVAGERREKG